LSKGSSAPEALKIYSDLLGQRLVPAFVREKVLREACDLARARGDSARLAAWYPELERFNAASAKGKGAKK
ncbi:MAG: hypothetical protein IJW12_06245, partial [Opitutales bacterium]|nr:hypothetical protein [Opitutales bacterium]